MATLADDAGRADGEAHMSTVEQNELQTSESVNAISTVTSASTDADVRRPRGSTRVPFDGVVEVGGELGPPFEAQAVDVSGTGMHLRTAYLPETGQTLSCRFEAGRETVIATGEVVWHREAGRGGEFGLRFIDLDAESATALERMTDRARLNVPGAKVRLHIEGLGAPMRARVKGTTSSELTVGSELGFLQVGKHIDLEDAESGRRRPAYIDRVEVEINPSSRIPQLVVALKYEDAEEDMADEHVPNAMPAGDSGDHGHEAAAPARRETQQIAAMNVDDDMHARSRDGHAHDDEDGALDDGQDMDVRISEPMPHGAMNARVAAQADDEDDDDLANSMALKGPVARAASKVAPALERFAKRTKTTAMLLMDKAKARRYSESSPIRRTTAPPPGGGLTTAGRKVVRNEPFTADKSVAAASPMVGLMADRKKMTIIGAGAVAVLAIGVAFAAKKPAAPPGDTATASAPIAADPTIATPAPAGATLPGALPPAPIVPSAPTTVEIASSATSDPFMADKNPVGDSSDSRPNAKKPGIKVAPFSNGGISRGNLLRLKMDGAIEKIQGAQQPTGFIVHLPGRRSLEPAAPLALRDARIGSIKVANDPSGAELSVTFKDGVPRYTVRAKGDQLEIVLASPNAPNAPNATAATSHDAPPAKPHKKAAKRNKHRKAH